MSVLIIYIWWPKDDEDLKNVIQGSRGEIYCGSLWNFMSFLEIEKKEKICLKIILV